MKRKYRSCDMDLHLAILDTPRCVAFIQRESPTLGWIAS